jgi:hypothetical protein
MSPNHRGALLASLLAIVLSSANIGCGGSSASVQAIKVSMAKTTATVEAGTTAQFTATVADDSSNKGVNWTVSCSAPPCGSVSPTSTASGAPTTYTPPTSQTANLTVTLLATSVSDATKSASVVITVPAVTITLSLTSVTLQLGATSPFSATVANDGANLGVNWNVACPQADCGSVSPVSTASGDATTYKAPTAPPAGDLNVTLTATSATDSAVLATATITIPGIVITLSPASASVPSGGTQSFSASVTGDPNGASVKWSVFYLKASCSIFTRRCGPPFSFIACTTCGTVAPSSGAAVTYTAPAAFSPPTFFLSFRGVYLQATSITNASAVTRAAITILPISVSVSPSPASVALKGTQAFTATVTNDGSNSGVSWSLTQSGSSCSPGCGTISAGSSLSGANVTYSAPTTAPPLPLLTLTATSVEDSRKSASTTITLTTSTGLLACGAGSGSESLLNGQYGFALSGTDSSGFAGAAGSITASGTGNITAGEEDVVSQGNGTLNDVAINTGSVYAIGPDHRGCMILTNANGTTSAFRFALGSIDGSGVATAGRILEFDDTTGSGTRLSGTIRLQDSTSFTASQFKGSYAFGVVGVGFALANPSRFAMIGTFAADGVSALSSGNFDIDEGGTVTSNITASPGGSFTCCSTNGRGTLTLQAYNVPTLSFYMLSNGSALLINSGGPIVVGELHGIAAATSFSQSSLSGSAVLRSTGQSSTGPVVDVALASADGSGNITSSDNINAAGAFTTSSAKFTYNVASNGRVTLTGSSTPPVLYLYGPSQGYWLGTDASVTFGILDPQAAGPFSNASFSGAYTIGTDYPSASTATLESGALTANGAGTASGHSDHSSSAGLGQNQNLNLNYSIAADGTGNVGSGTTAIVISTDNLVFINNTDPNPTVTVVEK